MVVRCIIIVIQAKIVGKKKSLNIEFHWCWLKRQSNDFSLSMSLFTIIGLCLSAYAFYLFNLMNRASRLSFRCLYLIFIITLNSPSLLLPQLIFYNRWKFLSHSFSIYIIYIIFLSISEWPLITLVVSRNAWKIHVIKIIDKIRLLKH